MCEPPESDTGGEDTVLPPANTAPASGAANQLIAALAFLVIAVYLIGIGKPSIHVIVPGIFVLITTVAALCYQSYTLLVAPEPNWVLAGICVVLIALAVYVSTEAVPRLRQVAPAARSDESDVSK